MAAHAHHCKVRLFHEAHGLLQDDADAWGNNPFDYGAMPAETGSDSVQAADLALLDGRIQAYQSERMWSCDGTQHDQR